MNTSRYITYIIQKALQIHARDEAHALCLSYLESPRQMMRELNAVYIPDKWGKTPRYPLPDPQVLMEHAEHFGILSASGDKEGELLLLSQEGRLHYAVYRIVANDTAKGLQSSMKGILEYHYRYGDAFPTHGHDPDV